MRESPPGEDGNAFPWESVFRIGPRYKLESALQLFQLLPRTRNCGTLGPRRLPCFPTLILRTWKKEAGPVPARAPRILNAQVVVSPVLAADTPPVLLGEP